MAETGWRTIETVHPVGNADATGAAGMSAAETDIERCARALWDSWQASEVVTDQWRGISWDTILAVPNDASLMVRRAADSEVSAVLSALREPSEGMLKAGGETFTRRGFMTVDFEGQPYLAFQAMIDAALGEKG